MRFSAHRPILPYITSRIHTMEHGQDYTHVSEH